MSRIPRGTGEFLPRDGTVSRSRAPLVEGGSMGSIEIRRATSFDIPQIVPLWEELAAFHAALDSAFAISPEGREAYAEYLHALMRNREAFVVVALDRTEAVGYAVGRISTLPRTFLVQRRGYIHDVYVREGYRLRGIGRQLVEEVLRWFQERGITLVELTVATFNLGAKAFWEKLGFVGYMVHMRRELGPLGGRPDRGGG